MSENNFTKLAAIDVSRHIEKKNGLSYLSWAWAVHSLLSADATANWSFPEAQTFPDGTMMVFCEVTAFGITRRAFLPVMDYRNKPIANPDAFAVNTAMQRCLVKAIALHGLGLHIYAGEDTNFTAEAPVEAPTPVWTPELLESAREAASIGVYQQWWSEQSDAFRKAAIRSEEHSKFKAANGAAR